MEKIELELHIGSVLSREKSTNIFGILPPTITAQLRGKVIGLCGDQVVIEDSLTAVEQRVQANGWKHVRLIQGPPMEDISLEELEDRG